MIATIPSAVVLGVEGHPVTVEVHVATGLPAFTLVGLPDAACREARDRVRAAWISSQLSWPQRRITVNLAPSGLRKGGTGFDLAVAVGLLVATGELAAAAVAGMGFLGELGLDGAVRRVPGTISLAEVVRAPVLVVAPDAVGEARLVERHEVRAVGSLRQLVDVLSGEGQWSDPPPDPPPLPAGPEPDLAEVRGQRLGRWALEVAAAGGHHLLLSGPPGAGKTLLARRLPGVLPALTRQESLDVTRIHSAAGLLLPSGRLVTRPPFRAPHHSSSAVALVGGGHTTLRPGEISLAHNGVLFLDELAEFPASVLDTLRQPVEEGIIRISRVRATVTFPARFLLVAAMNPCPCGLGGPPGMCRCSDYARSRYARKVSGPLLDRFDLRLPVSRADAGELVSGESGEPTDVVAQRVAAVRALAVDRGVRSNADIPAPRLDELGPLSPGGRRAVEWRLRRGSLSARGLHRVRRVARTIADLDGAPHVISEEHVCAALELRVEPEVLEAAS